MHALLDALVDATMLFERIVWRARSALMILPQAADEPQSAPAG